MGKLRMTVTGLEELSDEDQQSLSQMFLKCLYFSNHKVDGVHIQFEDLTPTKHPAFEEGTPEFEIDAAISRQGAVDWDEQHRLVENIVAKLKNNHFELRKLCGASTSTGEINGPCVLEYGHSEGWHRDYYGQIWNPRAINTLDFWTGEWSIHE